MKAPINELIKTYLQNSGDLKVKGMTCAFASFFHVPENGRSQIKIAPESGQKDHLFYLFSYSLY